MRNFAKFGTRVLIVDDHPVVLWGFRSLFASDSTVKIDEATDARSGHRAYFSRKPDVMVIDIALPDVSGFELMSSDPQGRSRRQNHHVRHKRSFGARGSRHRARRAGLYLEGGRS